MLVVLLSLVAIGELLLISHLFSDVIIYQKKYCHYMQHIGDGKLERDYGSSHP